MLERYVRNQFGDDVLEYCVIFDGDKWYEEWLNCYSSQDLGFGTCQCQTHSTYKERRLSRQEVIYRLGKEITKLTKQEREDLNKVNSFEENIREKVALQGFTWEQMEDWALACYQWGLNPIPTLRHVLGIPVEFRYAPAVYELTEGRQGLICELKTDDEKNPEWVRLVIIDEGK